MRGGGAGGLLRGRGGGMFFNRPIAELSKACRASCCLVLFCISMPAASQTLRGNCGNPDPDISIPGCTRKIESDAADLKSGRGILQATVAHLATDYDNRGVAYASKGLYDQAIADFDQAISLLPKTFPMAYFNRGSAYDNQGLDDKAIADYTMAISLEPTGAGRNLELADAYDYRGNVYERNGFYDKAIADFTMAISLNPDLESAYANRGNDYLRKALYDLAIADFSEVISRDSRDVGSRYNRALAYEHKGLYDEAITDLTKEISLAPRFASAYAHRAEAYEHKGAVDAAIVDYRAALKLDAGLRSAKDALARLGAVPDDGPTIPAQPTKPAAGGR